jgi:hypothetical protein
VNELRRLAQRTRKDPGTTLRHPTLRKDEAGWYLVDQGRKVRLPTSGAGTPEGNVAAPVGALYTRTDGGSGSTLYVKESGTGTSGWRAV